MSSEGLLNRRSRKMLHKNTNIGKIAFFGVLAAGLVLYSAPAAFAASDVVSKYDTDKDKTLDLAEVKAAAGAEFDKLDADADKTLDTKEAKGALGKKDFKAGDTDNDGTLTKDEYLAIVEQLFKKADVDNEGTLSAKELKSKAGRALQKLID